MFTNINLTIKEEFRERWNAEKRATLNRLAREKASIETFLKGVRQSTELQAEVERWGYSFTEQVINDTSAWAEGRLNDLEGMFADTEAYYDECFEEAWTEWVDEHGNDLRDDLEDDAASWRVEQEY